MKTDASLRWLRFWQRVRARGSCENIFYQLADHYNGPGRFYHTLDHITKCINELESVRSLCQHQNEVEAALWFHDVIYNTRADDNEERSAEFAKEALKEMGLPDSFRERVSRFILFTKHIEIPREIDAQIVVDIDLLSGLGPPFEEFKRNGENIRKEYEWIPEERFRIGRIDLLKKFLRKKQIFLTDFFRKKYEDRARLNIRRALINLEQK